MSLASSSPWNKVNEVISERMKEPHKGRKMLLEKSKKESGDVEEPLDTAFNVVDNSKRVKLT